MWRLEYRSPRSSVTSFLRVVGQRNRRAALGQIGDVFVDFAPCVQNPPISAVNPPMDDDRAGVFTGAYRVASKHFGGWLVPGSSRFIESSFA